jgi:hypothetical protein
MNQTFTKNLWSKRSAPTHDYFLEHCRMTPGSVAMLFCINACKKP